MTRCERLHACRPGRGAEKTGQSGRDREPLSCSLPPPCALAGFPDLLCQPHHWGGLDRPEEIYREGRHRRIQEPAHRPGPLSSGESPAWGGGSAAYGNAATRIEAFAYSKGANSWIKEPELDEWYIQQSRERDHTKRQALLHTIQQKLYDDVRFIPIWELGFLCASGPQVAVSGLGQIPMFAYSGPYEDVQLKS
jgi:hypothetical protein